MSQYLINGGGITGGKINASGNKNAALPCIAAAILTDEKVTLRNIPNIEDVQVMLDVYRSFGGTVEQKEKNVYCLCLGNIKEPRVPLEAAKKIRASILFAGPLVARTGKAILPPP